MPEEKSKPSPDSALKLDSPSDRVLEFMACEFYLGAKLNDANRFKLREVLDIDIKVADAVTKRLTGRIFRVLDVKPLQVVPLDMADIDVSYFKSLTADDIIQLHKFTRLSKLYALLLNNYADLYLLDLEKQIAGLSSNKRQLLSAYTKALVAEDAPPLKKAPEFYVSKEVSGEIVPFLNRVYAEFMDGISFGRKELFDLDRKAHSALGSYETRVRKVPLSELNLPTASQKLDNLTAGFTERQLSAAATVYKTRRRRAP